MSPKRAGKAPKKPKRRKTPASTVEVPADQYDSPWKEISSRFFPQIVKFFAPDAYAAIDWSAGYELLEQELREVLRDAETGPRRVDKVVKVRLLSGKDVYLVFHVEIQVTSESGFEQRMFVYYYRLYDLYPERVLSLAILADHEPGWKPDCYKHELLGTVDLSFGYKTVKLWDYYDRWAELEQNPSPIAVVVMAHLKTKATRGDVQERLRWKVELVRQLYGRGYDREDVLELFRLIDWLLALPKDMERSFRQTIDQLEQEPNMKYVTSIERLSREEGLEAGRQEVVLSQIEERFGPVDDSLRKTIERASGEQVLQWAKKLLSASSLDEVFVT